MQVIFRYIISAKIATERNFSLFLQYADISESPYPKKQVNYTFGKVTA